MQYIAQLLALTAVANAAVYQRDAALEVTLTEVDHAVVKATVKNTGTAPLNLLKYGTFFDQAPVQKFNVHSAASKVPFEGVKRQIQTKNLKEDVFHLLAAGATFETEVNAASLYTLETGKYSVTAQGAIPYAAPGSTELSGKAVHYKSNTLELPVDGKLAAQVKKAVLGHAKRAQVQSDCSSDEAAATADALSNCAQLAQAAAEDAATGSDTFNVYFKSSDESVLSDVAARLTAVADECSSQTSGATQYFCTDANGYCESNVLAYTIPAQDVVVNCPLYYSALPALSDTCHEQDQATTTLHEFTHAPGVYSPGTDDLGYGYDAATALSTEEALNNADSYALYANALYTGC